MKKERRGLEQLSYMYRRTDFMKRMSAELEDKVLEYLYGMVLTELEEKMGKAHEQQSESKDSSVDPLIAEIAQMIVSGSPAKN